MTFIIQTSLINGKPAFLDITVHNSLQPRCVCDAALEDGAAENAGGMEKDERHEFNVTQ